MSHRLFDCAALSQIVSQLTTIAIGLVSNLIFYKMRPADLCNLLTVALTVEQVADLDRWVERSYMVSHHKNLYKRTKSWAGCLRSDQRTQSEV